jgi:Periplasmic binding protein-like domain
MSRTDWRKACGRSGRDDRVHRRQSGHHPVRGRDGPGGARGGPGGRPGDAADEHRGRPRAGGAGVRGPAAAPGGRRAVRDHGPPQRRGAGGAPGHPGRARRRRVGGSHGLLGGPRRGRGGDDRGRRAARPGPPPIGIINNADPTLASTGRLEGYNRALERAGILPDPRLVVAATDIGPEGGYRGARQLLALPERPTALFCFRDLMAMGVYRAALEAGLDIPGTCRSSGSTTCS